MRPGDVPAPPHRCECCRLPTVHEKSPGIGYYCVRCVGHVDPGSGWQGNLDADLAVREQDHALMRAVWVWLTDRDACYDLEVDVTASGDPSSPAR